MGEDEVRREGEEVHWDNVVLALLFASDEPLSAKRIAHLLELDSPQQVIEALGRIRSRLDREALSIMVESVAGGYQLATRPEYAPFIARLYTGRRRQRLSRAALETLAIIAYKQPITRAEIEQIRGVSCGGVISTLMERSLTKIVGKAKVLGAPYLYGTTRQFLAYLGLNSLKDLPSLEELERMLAEEEYQAEEAAADDAPQEGSTSRQCGTDESNGEGGEEGA